MEEQIHEIPAKLKELSSEIDVTVPGVAVILAAGHGKRIRSERSKMLHEIWGVPSVTRVCQAAREGLVTDNQIIVVGNKAIDVAEVLGKTNCRSFVYQENQHGTGDAVRAGLQALPEKSDQMNIYVFPGDIGLLDPDDVRAFREKFESISADMSVLTSMFNGDYEQNYYGRVIRVPEYDVDGKPAENDHGSIIEIKEHRDILSMSAACEYRVQYNHRTYSFTRDQLLRNREFNTGIYAFKARPLLNYIDKIQSDNVKGEFYLTDLISIFNQNQLHVGTSLASNSKTVLGFNNKSVLKEMEKCALEKAYDQLKDIITIQDKDDFFIADEVIAQLHEMDKNGVPLDIEIGKGVHISANVRLNRGVVIKNRSVLNGNIEFGEAVTIHENVHMSTYPSQVMRLGNYTEILQGDIIKGNLNIGENCRIESGVIMTGSDEFPIRIGNNVLIKGTSYIFGSIVEDDVFIEHSILKCKTVERLVRKDGSIQPIRWVLPLPEGLDTIEPISKI